MRVNVENFHPSVSVTTISARGEAQTIARLFESQALKVWPKPKGMKEEEEEAKTTTTTTTTRHQPHKICG